MLKVLQCKTVGMLCKCRQNVQKRDGQHEFYIVWRQNANIIHLFESHSLQFNKIIKIYLLLHAGIGFCEFWSNETLRFDFVVHFQIVWLLVYKYIIGLEWILILRLSIQAACPCRVRPVILHKCNLYVILSNSVKFFIPREITDVIIAFQYCII